MWRAPKFRSRRPPVSLLRVPWRELQVPGNAPNNARSIVRSLVAERGRWSGSPGPRSAPLRRKYAAAKAIANVIASGEKHVWSGRAREGDGRDAGGKNHGREQRGASRPIFADCRNVSIRAMRSLLPRARAANGRRQSRRPFWRQDAGEIRLPLPSNRGPAFQTTGFRRALA